MPKKSSAFTVKDQFCGGGGSSRGVMNFAKRKAPGVEVKVALNHWPLAIKTHNTNFPDTIHDCTDISACDPRRYPSTDVLITSPECTKQTNANGKKKPKKQMEMFVNGKLDPAEERSRATMWDVPRFAEYHEYNAIIVENVVEAREWVMYDSWIHAMYALGYKHKCVYLNSMHCHPTPQSRDRMYVVFWKKGNKAPNLEFMPTAYCPRCEKDVLSIQTWKNPLKRYGKYNKQYVYCCPFDGCIIEPYYYAAYNCIDWSIPGRRIGDIKPDLVPNTIRRIGLGINTYFNDGNQYKRAPFIVKGEYSKAADESYVKSVYDPLMTQATWQTFGITMPPFMIENKGQSTFRDITKPISCFTTKTYHGITTTESFNSFISYYNGGSDVSSHIMQPAGTFVGTDRHGLLTSPKPDIQDCYYRTLKAHEVKLGMGFDKDYIILGNGKEQVKQCGNAVTPPVMEQIFERVYDSLN